MRTETAEEYMRDSGDLKPRKMLAESVERG
jgi:hypothetical protein